MRVPWTQTGGGGRRGCDTAGRRGRRVMGMGGIVHAHTHAHTRARAHAHAHTHTHAHIDTASQVRVEGHALVRPELKLRRQEMRPNKTHDLKHNCQQPRHCRRGTFERALHGDGKVCENVPSMCVCVCVCVCLSACLSVCMPIYCLPVCLFASLCLSIPAPRLFLCELNVRHFSNACAFVVIVVRFCCLRGCTDALSLSGVQL